MHQPYASAPAENADTHDYYTADLAPQEWEIDGCLAVPTNDDAGESER
jgi:hypothetical protein